jgi:hypothetical protein
MHQSIRGRIENECRREQRKLMWYYPGIPMERLSKAKKKSVEFTAWESMIL